MNLSANFHNELIRESVKSIFPQEIISIIPTHAGDISKSYIVDLGGEHKKIFCKICNSDDLVTPHRILPSEANALILLREIVAELALGEDIVVPEVFYVDDDILLMQALEMNFLNEGRFFTSDGKGDFFEFFGKSLARLHKWKAPFIGLDEDNYIGRIEQINTPKAKDNSSLSWAYFFWEKRLLFQFELSFHRYRDGALKEMQKLLYAFEDYVLKKLAEVPDEDGPSVLHGDLWSGNFLQLGARKVALFDPALYYGHRETDLAMTKLFGGFSTEFYEGYEKEFPLAKGHEEREEIYKLYHLLNHFNMFGGPYGQQAFFCMSYLLERG